MLLSGPALVYPQVSPEEHGALLALFSERPTQLIGSGFQGRGLKRSRPSPITPMVYKNSRHVNLQVTSADD